MDIREAIKARHSVRKYKDMPIAEDVKEKLEEMIRRCNEESGLHMQLICDDPECFDSQPRTLAHCGYDVPKALVDEVGTNGVQETRGKNFLDIVTSETDINKKTGSQSLRQQNRSRMPHRV